MESVKELCKNILENNCLVVAWAVIVLVILIILVFTNREKFLGEFQKAPITTQRSTDVLGIGSNSRFATEFSGTNQGRSHVAADTVKITETMTGGMEPPIFNDVNSMLHDYQHSEVKNEKFTNRAFMEGFSGENKLLQTLHGN